MLSLLLDTQNEFQMLISGTSNSVDLDDLRQHTVYHQYTEDSETVQMFWEVVLSLSLHLSCHSSSLFLSLSLSLSFSFACFLSFCVHACT